MRNIFFFAAAGLFFAAAGGCVTTPRMTAGMPVMSIGGSPYVSLAAVCERKAIAFDYDVISRRINIDKDGNRIDLKVGEQLYLVNGAVHRLRHPVELSGGMVMIPLELRGNTFDLLFKDITDGEPGVQFYRIKRVVIDAGHGGKDPGAIGKSGLKEKIVTLDIARRLRTLLEQQGLQVEMTRSSDHFVGLNERVALTNKANADLFVSIHANANRSRSLNGFEVYYLSPKVSDQQRALASAKSGLPSVDEGSLASSSSTLRAILWDMVYSYSRAESIDLSRQLCERMQNDLEAKDLGVKCANFCVLRGATVPAVLVEVGFLSNKEEEQILAQDTYRQKLAQTIMRGIADYSVKLAQSTR
jgi:N-acetylmuramoyl-L-alanine amidase